MQSHFQRAAVDVHAPAGSKRVVQAHNLGCCWAPEGVELKNIISKVKITHHTNHSMKFIRLQLNKCFNILTFRLRVHSSGGGRRILVFCQLKK